MDADSLSVVFTILGEQGSLEHTSLVCKEWNAVSHDLAAFWRLSAQPDDFMVVQYESRYKEIVRVKHVPSGSVLVQDEDVSYDAANKPALSFSGGRIELSWMHNHAKMRRCIGIGPEGIRWSSGAMCDCKKGAMPIN